MILVDETSSSASNDEFEKDDLEISTVNESIGRYTHITDHLIGGFEIAVNVIFEIEWRVQI